MPYILYKTDGTKLTTVDDATLDLTTNLAFVGRNYSGYGQVVNENFLKLLENFSSATAPSSPLRGQLWYDKENKKLNLSHDGKTFKGIANIFIQNYSPSYSSLTRGDLWWDSDSVQLKAFDGSRFQVIGPFNPAAGRATWIPGEETTGDNSVLTAPISKAVIDNSIIAVVSNQEFLVVDSSSLNNDNIPLVKKGITLSGADVNGKSDQSGVLLWGTAAHSLYSNTATVALTAKELEGGGTPSLKSSSSTNITSYYNTATVSSVPWTIVQRDGNSDIYARYLQGTATSAKYADLAEKYHADYPYEAGTVLVIGGTNEVTVTTLRADTAVIGVVSTNPAVMMNSEAGPDDMYPYIALKGRVPCKVVGNVKKGELLVTSSVPGCAQVAVHTDHGASIIGKALEDFVESSGPGVIEILVI